MLDVDTGCALYDVKCFCLVFKPFKGEILFAVASQVTSQGIFCHAGPLEIFISQKLVPSHYSFDDISQSYISEEGDFTIAKETPMRVKLTGVRLNANEIKSVGTIKGELLGPFEM